MSKISIIMPVYNVEKYLVECLQSVVGQTLRDLEVICVDDGSKDNCSQILDDFAAKDPRIKVIHKENSGYGHSMNTGLDMATGEYVAIVEPDDYIKPDMMENLYNKAKENDLEVIKADFSEFCGEGTDRVFKLNHVVSDLELYNRILKPVQIEQIFRGYVLNQAGIYKRTFLKENNIRFHETPGASYQDVSVWFQIMIKADRLMLDFGNYYQYRIDNPNASMANIEKVYCICDEFDYLYNILKTEGNFSSVLPIYQFCRWNHYLVTLDRIAKQFKHQFLKKMQEDFLSSKNKKEMDLSFFKTWEKDQFDEMVDQPDNYYEKTIRLSEIIHKIILPYDRIVIFGAGMLGKKILREMDREDRKKLAGFAVTNMEGNLSLWDGLRVLPIECFDDEKKELAVLVGVTDKYKKEVVDFLTQRGYENILIPIE